MSSRRSTPKIRIAMATTDSAISGSAMAQFISAALPPPGPPASSAAVWCCTIAATEASQKPEKLDG